MTKLQIIQSFIKGDINHEYCGLCHFTTDHPDNIRTQIFAMFGQCTYRHVVADVDYLYVYVTSDCLDELLSSPIPNRESDALLSIDHTTFVHLYKIDE